MPPGSVLSASAMFHETFGLGQVEGEVVRAQVRERHMFKDYLVTETEIHHRIVAMLAEMGFQLMEISNAEIGWR